MGCGLVRRRRRLRCRAKCKDGGNSGHQDAGLRVKRSPPGRAGCWSGKEPRKLCGIPILLGPGLRPGPSAKARRQGERPAGRHGRCQRRRPRGGPGPPGCRGVERGLGATREPGRSRALSGEGRGDTRSYEVLWAVPGDRERVGAVGGLRDSGRVASAPSPSRPGRGFFSQGSDPALEKKGEREAAFTWL